MNKLNKFWALFVAISLVMAISLVPLNYTQGLKANISYATGENQGQELDLEYVNDFSDVLTKEEEDSFREFIALMREAYLFDVVILTTDDLEGKTAEAYADDFFDYGGYGYGENYDGILFLINPVGRDYAISTCGYGITAFTDYGLSQIEDLVIPYLKDGDWYGAFGTFLTTVPDYLDAADQGEPIDSYGGYEGQTPGFMGYLLLGLVFSMFLAFIITYNLKLKMKTAVKASTAKEYISPGSFSLYENNDTYLYTTTTRTKIEKESSGGGGGGSSTHSSSSGRSHGGSSGKF